MGREDRYLGVASTVPDRDPPSGVPDGICWGGRGRKNRKLFPAPDEKTSGPEKNLVLFSRYNSGRTGVQTPDRDAGRRDMSVEIQHAA